MPDTLTWIELDKRAFWHNVAQLVQCCRGSATLGIVLKGNAYGHGMREMAQLAQAHPDITWLFVAALSEALALREQGITKPILAMSYHDASLKEAVRKNISLAVFDKETVRELDTCARDLGLKAHIHIKVDSNMCRLGVAPQELASFVDWISCETSYLVPVTQPGAKWVMQELYFVNSCSSVHIEGVFTHLSDINNPDLAWSHEQTRVFNEALARVPWSTKPLCHAYACGALTLNPLYDIVRAGTNLFGFWKSDVQTKRFLQKFPQMTLQQVMTWKTKIIQIKTVPAGSYVGYNRTFCTQRPTKLAVLPVGYFDGYPRALSNKGRVLVHGHCVPVVGMVSMYLTTIDVTDRDCSVGDEVILLGKQPGVTVNEIAALAGTINNELVTRINPQIRRSIVEDV